MAIRATAIGDETTKTKLEKPNIVGKIKKNNYSYKDIERLDPLYPEERIKAYSGVKQNRVRMTDITDFPDRLPTADLFPYPVDEDDFIGQMETKKNLYLISAYAYNKLMGLIEELESRVAELEL